MHSPFPGMDPFLENPKLWSRFQHHLTESLMQAIAPTLSDRMSLVVECRRYVTEEPLFTSIIREQHDEPYLVIRKKETGSILCLIDYPSITNKTLPQGRTAYLQTRQNAKDYGAALIEIDLLLQGKPLLEFNREGLPEWDYAVTVVRPKFPDRYEIYSATLGKRLPRFKLPIRGEDRDGVIDLQMVVQKTINRSNLLKEIDYKTPLPSSFPEAKREWIQKFLNGEITI